VKPIYEENEQKKEPSFESSLKIPESVKLVVKSHAHFALFCAEISLTTAE